MFYRCLNSIFYLYCFVLFKYVFVHEKSLKKNVFRLYERGGFRIDADNRGSTVLYSEITFQDDVKYRSR